MTTLMTIIQDGGGSRCTMSEPEPKRARWDEGTPRRHRRTQGRRLAVTDGEGCGSPRFQARPVSLRMVKDSPVRRAIQSSVTAFKLSKGGKMVRKPPGSPIEARIEDPLPSHRMPFIVPQAVILPEKLVSGGDSCCSLQLTAISPAPLVCTG